MDKLTDEQLDNLDDLIQREMTDNFNFTELAMLIAEVREGRRLIVQLMHHPYVARGLPPEDTLRALFEHIDNQAQTIAYERHPLFMAKVREGEIVDIQEVKETVEINKDTPSYADDPYVLWITCPHCGEDNIFCQINREAETWGAWGEEKANFCPDCGAKLKWKE